MNVNARATLMSQFARTDGFFDRRPVEKPPKRRRDPSRKKFTQLDVHGLAASKNTSSDLPSQISNLTLDFNCDF